SMSSSPPYQCATVVKTESGVAQRGGHQSSATHGGVYCHLMPPSGKSAPGQPTVSPIVKYVVCGASLISPLLSQTCSSPGSMSIMALRRKQLISSGGKS